ncbi:hypothetical protein FB45DRAFT_1116466 [Roridomyces roridus]|uniref:F-box domain-containing protein n=1 Tax=Roridomyces roridus TaxID=1738132 RepID=A0AAD7FYL3_9AGAR|nr:hypothetical protein FB45DRAFT_1116466 [Roridomyces roridus]
MSARERVPTEIWLEIFGHLPRSSLKQTSLTQREFKIPSRTLLFDHFRLQPYASHYARSGAVPHTPAVVQRNLERLDFWSSAEIAPLVREYSIAVEQITDLPAKTDTSPFVVLAAFFDRFERLTGLKKLSAQGVHFSQTGVIGLCRSSVLVDLEVKHCYIMPGERIDTTGLQLRLSRFRYSHPWSGTRPNPADVEKPDLWIPLLHPEHLRVLHVWVDPQLKVMSETMALGPTFPHVHKLITSVDPGTLARNRLAWDKFPGVRTLDLMAWGYRIPPLGEAHPVLSPDVMPLLEEYIGLPHALHIFAARATLRRVHIDHCSLEQLISSLEWVQSPQVTSFSIDTLDVLDVSSLSVIFDSFPMLETMSILVLNNDDDDDGGEGGCPDSTVCTRRTKPSAVPTTNNSSGCKIFLPSRRINHTSDEPAVPNPGMGIRVPLRRPAGIHRRLAEIPAMRKKLRERCPALRKLWLEGIHFVSTWRLHDEDEDEEGEEKTTLGTIGSKGNGHEDFWDH